MKPATTVRLGLITAIVLALEILTRIGVIARFVAPPPSEMMVGLWRLLLSGRVHLAITQTLSKIAIACSLAIVVGILMGVAIQRFRGLADAMSPFFTAYYAVPVYAFYPMMIAIFGIGEAPQIVIGFMLAVVAVVVNTINALDRIPRVLRKTAAVYGMRPLEAARRIYLPHAGPYLATGVKLAVSYSFIGVIGAEFIMSRIGIGHEIVFAYNNFENEIMYPLILFVLLVAGAVNGLFYAWEKRLLSRRSRS
ncbi:MAG: ABC transporter permease subunit [Bosea sp.]|jgi:NitT/TauT family transport system permease protein|uniref:ABC transporter permease n=1 Tax=Hyphomicrobiales TaxID=356 RepID=UPI000831042F|nr:MULTISPECIES: ABC transporter permease subunit [Hyphomicrobiales]MCP4561861.1 ABC transporter permease subunit [Bosea sp. (in: a-proteobacteria)]MCP4738178.1 ABC transporter permease subunit [Bosea sp. (in: a-proteobacteria)]MDX3804866.1 ABC transporter permease subunit [Bosea sp. (in: a-proteobacteria)]